MADAGIDLTSFFEALETNFPLSGVRATLSEKVGTDVTTGLERAGLLTFLRVSDTYPCPQPGGLGCPRQVARPDGEIIAVCGNDPPECDEVRLSPRDVELLGVVPERLLEALRSPLGIGGTVRRVEGLAHTYQAGSFIPQSAIKHPVFFTAAASQGQYALVLDALRSRVDGSSFAVLVPTDRFVSAETVRQFRVLGIPIVSLADTVRLSTAGKLKAVTDFQSILNTIGKRTTAPKGSRAEVFADVLTAGGWRTLTEREYREFITTADRYAIFADERRRTAIKMEGRQRKETRNIQPSFFRMLRMAAETSGRFDPNVNGLNDNQVSGKQIFQRARNALDLKRNGRWVLFKTEMMDNHAQYVFQPDSDVEFALVFLPKF
jgi:hypothetical protein